MIDYHRAKKYCCEDLSLIENYEKASKDLIQTWDIHHRKEDEGYSMKELKDLGLYHGRPASELIFLTKKEHMRLHCKMKIGVKNPYYGRTGEKHHGSKPVHQIDLKTGQIIKTWTCAAEVERQLGIHNQHISKCCKGKRNKTGGYGWQYADI